MRAHHRVSSVQIGFKVKQETADTQGANYYADSSSSSGTNFKVSQLLARSLHVSVVSKSLPQLCH